MVWTYPMHSRYGVYGVCDFLTFTDFHILQRMSRVERSAWILMDLIHPPLSQGYMVRPGGEATPQIVDMVSELGIFGVVIGDADNIVHNYQAGHMLRTKLSTANEGGVAAGLGALDSPYLIDSEGEEGYY